MQLTPDILDRYKGGQAEIQNPREGYMFRGEVDDIYVSGGTLTIRFAWMAEAKGFPPLPARWVNYTPRDYRASLELYSVSDIGDGRIALQSLIVGETTVLFPAGGSTLDPSKVEGLEFLRS